MEDFFFGQFCLQRNYEIFEIKLQCSTTMPLKTIKTFLANKNFFRVIELKGHSDTFTSSYERQSIYLVSCKIFQHSSQYSIDIKLNKAMLACKLFQIQKNDFQHYTKFILNELIRKKPRLKTGRLLK